MKAKMASAQYAASAWDHRSGAMEPAAMVLPIFVGQDTDAPAMGDVVKRWMDVIGALAGIILTLPLWALIAMAIKLTSRGPVFFTQQRAGLGGRPFRMFKFRSMVVDAEERLHAFVNIETLREPVYKLADDPRVTRVGRFLRRFGLDELPQLINVLRGEMSLVGPRPEMMKLVRRYNAEQCQRLLVKPGITGYQQIHNRGMPDMRARLAYDLYYIEHRGVLLDLWILAMTVLVIASGKEITY